MLIEEMLAACAVAHSTVDGEWRIDEDPPVTLLFEVGQSVLGLERVTLVRLQGRLAVVTSARETHYMPAERLVGLKVAATNLGASGGGGKRAGFM